jgi:hypothetical protein
MANVKETQDLLAAIRTCAQVFKDVMEDGKFNLMDLPKLAPVWNAVEDAVNGVNLVPGELQDLSKEEAQALLADVWDTVLLVLTLVKK